MSADIIQYLYIIPISLISITFHEFMHGYVSYRLGDPTARAMGRLTLNPIKHIDPIGLLMMIFAHIGWAKPVPINPAYYRKRKSGTILVSVAGPLTNLTLAFLFSIPLIWLDLRYRMGMDGLYITFSALNFLHNVSYVFIFLNVGLAVFNLLPIPPLDGSKILSGILPTETYFKFMRYERYIGIAFLAIVLLVPGILSTIITPMEDFFIGVFKAIWTPVLSLFL
jgi:Zn-dependent protease